MSAAIPSEALVSHPIDSVAPVSDFAALDTAPAALSPPPSEVLVACRRVMSQLLRDGARSIGVTSTIRGEGRTTIATGLAIAASSALGRRTLLVEMDLGRPAFAKRLHTRATPGLSEFLRGDADLPDCIQWYSAGLGVISAGEPAPSVPELYTTLSASGVVSALDRAWDTVVCDLPPLTPAGLSVHASSLCSHVLLVLRAGVTSVRDVHRAVEELQAPPIVMLNGKKSKEPRWARSMSGG